MDNSQKREMDRFLKFTACTHLVCVASYNDSMHCVIIKFLVTKKTYKTLKAYFNNARLNLLVFNLVVVEVCVAWISGG